MFENEILYLAIEAFSTHISYISANYLHDVRLFVALLDHVSFYNNT